MLCPTDLLTGPAGGIIPERRGGSAADIANSTGSIIVLIISWGSAISGNIYSIGTGMPPMAVVVTPPGEAAPGDIAPAVNSTGIVIVLIIPAGIAISGKTYSTGTRSGPGAAGEAAAGKDTPAVTVDTAGAASKSGVMSPPVTTAGTIHVEAAAGDDVEAGLAPPRRLRRAGCRTPPRADVAVPGAGLVTIGVTGRAAPGGIAWRVLMAGIVVVAAGAGFVFSSGG